MSTRKTYIGEVTGKKFVLDDAAPELGRGGIGVVQRGECDGAAVAVKKLGAADSTLDRKERLIENIHNGSPHPDITWPWDVFFDESGSLRIAMHQFDAHLKPLTRIADSEAEPSDGVDVNLRTLTRLCFNLTDVMAACQGRGYCYGDPSTNQFHGDVATGQLAACDADGAFVDDGRTVTYLGTPFFMTPRLALQQERVTRSTDAFAVGVCLFKLQTFGFPFIGKRAHDIAVLGESDLRRLLFTDPQFVYDPVSSANRPVPGVDDHLIKGWARLPERTQSRFTELFTRGLYDPEHRVNLAVWRSEFKRLHDSICVCPRCPAEIYMDIHPGASQRCWNCQRQLVLPPRLRFKQAELILSKHAELYQHHVDGSSTADFTLAGKVVVDPARPNWWGLKNLSSAPWRARVRRRGVDETITVRPQEAVRITKNVKLYFPGASAVVEA